MKYLEISTKDLFEYKFTASRDNKIRSFWLIIIKSMSQELKNEVRHKQTDLEKVELNTYKFITKSASQNLEEFLNQFTIRLITSETDSLFNFHLFI
ncbi:hypothetical protein KC678_05320 [Candidatus Dojkabacteria bacterium]|uniref:Uncharacterized protein n=1 Tax=Candidatus Dojkabacteria bacterium TaxID=2099670 RepID=A0A955RHT2_9BACT|nr:hypothetical protein [Candidatus Dojkabacteria bacterium]